MEGLNVAIVGATGLVGREFIKILEQRNFPMQSLRLLASDRSAGNKLYIKHEQVEIKETTAQSFEGVDIALFSAGDEISSHFSPIAARNGAVVIDNSSAFRMDASVPLVVPEVNAEDIKEHKGIIANPNCSTIQMVVAIYPLHKVNPIKRIIVDSYQSASGIGSSAMEELIEQTKLALEGREIVPHLFPHQIAFNVLPETDLFLDNAYTKDEWRLVEETQKIMHAPEIAISATCVSVPVPIGHCEAIHIEFTKPMSPQEARQILAEAPGVRVQDDPGISLYPHPWAAAGTDDVFVGRIRKDVSHEHGLAMWVVSDNIRKGAALNTIQIAETMIERGWI
jgi:aspartate-semialdehyde dehydrogenase